MARKRRKQSRKRRKKNRPSPPHLPEVVQDPTDNTPQVRREVRTEIHFGPLPTPSDLAAYEQACPGLGRIIVETWQGQTEHRQRIEDRLVDAGISDHRLGTVFGQVASIVAILVSGVLIYSGTGWIGLGPVIVVVIIRRILARLLRVSKQQAEDQQESMTDLDQ